MECVIDENIWFGTIKMRVFVQKSALNCHVISTLLDKNGRWAISIQKK